MPTPRSNESESSFIQRCMTDSEANRDFPDSQQRVAFCYSVWEQSQKFVQHKTEKPRDGIS